MTKIYGSNLLIYLIFDAIFSGRFSPFMARKLADSTFEHTTGKVSFIRSRGLILVQCPSNSVGKHGWGLEVHHELRSNQEKIQ